MSQVVFNELGVSPSGETVLTSEIRRIAIQEVDLTPPYAARPAVACEEWRTAASNSSGGRLQGKRCGEPEDDRASRASRSIQPGIADGFGFGIGIPTFVRTLR